MGTQSDDLIRLTLDVKGVDVLDDLKQVTSNYKEVVRELGAEYSRGAITLDEYLDRSSKVRREMAKFEGASRSASKALGKGGGQGLGFAALEASRAIEDLQYGVGGVVNNIPGLVMALGGGAGAMAAFSLGAVAINQFVKHWGDLMEMMGRDKSLDLSTDSTKKLTEQLSKAKTEMEQLEKASRHTYEDLAKYTDAANAAAVAEKKLRESKERDKDIGEAVDRETGKSPVRDKDVVNAEKLSAEELKHEYAKKPGAFVDSIASELEKDRHDQQRERGRLYSQLIADGRKADAAAVLGEIQRIDALPRDYKGDAAAMLGRALRGDAGAHDKLADFAKAHPELDRGVSDEITQTSPSQKREIDRRTKAMQLKQASEEQERKQRAQTRNDEAIAGWQAKQHELEVLHMAQELSLYPHVSPKQAKAYWRARGVRAARQARFDLLREGRDHHRVVTPTELKMAAEAARIKASTQPGLGVDRAPKAPDPAAEIAKRSLELQKQGLSVQDAGQKALAEVIREMNAVKSRLNVQGRNARELQRAAAGLNTNQPSALQAGGPF